MDWRILGLFFVASCLAFLPWLGAFGILDPTDGLYSEGAREMVESGNYVTPTLNYQTFFEKPILIYWLIAGCYNVLGVSEFAARLPAALSGIATVVLMYVFCRQLLRRRQSVLTASTLLSSGLFVIVGHIAITDVPLTMVTVTAMMSLLIYLRRRQFAFLLVFYVALGLSCLLKGAVLLGEVGLTFLLYELLRRLVLGQSPWSSWWQLIIRLNPLLGLPLLALIAVPWYWAVDQVTHGEFTREFFVNQHLVRLTGQVNHANNPFWFYWPVLLGGFFPWSLLLFTSFPVLVRAFRRRRYLTMMQETALFSSIWAGVIWFLFNAVKTKLATYILPSLPAFCLLTGLLLDKWIRFKTPSLREITAPLNIVAVIGMGVFLIKYQSQFKTILPGTALVSWLGLLLLFAGTLVSALSLRRHEVKRAIWQLTLTSYLSVCVLVPAALMLTYQVSHQGLQDLLRLARQADANLVSYQRVFPAAAFYLRHEVPVLVTVEAVEEYRLTPKKPHYILCTEDTVNRFKLIFKPKTLITYRNKLYLFSLE